MEQSWLHKTIETDFFTLFPFIKLQEREREMIREWRNHPDIRRWMFTDHEISSEEHRGFLRRLEDDLGNFYWLVMEKSREYTGVISLTRVDFKHEHAYLGLYANPFRRGGAGRLLMEAVKHVAFGLFHLHTVKAEVFAGNAGAMRVYEKAGLTEEGRLKEFVRKDGAWMDVIVMGIVNRQEKP